MLLVIDIGNTNIVLGTFEGDELTRHWRLTTERRRTADEYGVLLRWLFSESGIDRTRIDDAIISCVVPPLQGVFVKMVEQYFGVRTLVVGPGVRTGMPILYENPREVGADRIVNAVGAYDRFDDALIVVDFGTATTFDAINAEGSYLGGVICPGVGISSEALFMRASKLPRVEIVPPDKVIGRNTVASIQSGIFYGYCSLVDGMVRRIQADYGSPMRVIATGGLAALFATESETIEEVDENLTLYGMRRIYERNVG